MKKVMTAVILGLFLAALSSPILAEEKKLDGEKLFQEKCSVCHSTERATKKRKDREGWTKTVKRMQKKLSGHISDEEAEAIIDYLVENHGEKSE